MAVCKISLVWLHLNTIIIAFFLPRGEGGAFILSPARIASVSTHNDLSTKFGLNSNAQQEVPPSNGLKDVQELRNAFYALRHGRSLANDAGVIAADPSIACQKYGLSPEGFAQAARAATVLRSELRADQGVTLVSSDLLRAVETSQTVLTELNHRQCENVAKMVLDVRLRERGFGTWDGTSDSNYVKVWEHDADDSGHTFNGVESVDSVMARATRCVLDLDAQYPEGNHVFVLVAHGDVLQILQTAFLKRDGCSHRSVDHLETAQLRPLVLQQV